MSTATATRTTKARATARAASRPQLTRNTIRTLLRIVLYARLSKDELGTKDGVERQEADMLADVERYNADSRNPHMLEVVAVLHDRAKSASGEVVRPNFERALAMLEENEADALWVNVLDRFTRCPTELERMIRLVEFYGVGVSTVAQGDLRLDTPEGRETARYQVTRARAELEHMSRRHKNKARHNAAAGKAHGRMLYGYMSGDEAGSRKRNPETAPAVEGAFVKLAAGESKHAVVRWLNAEHPRTARVSPTTGEAFGGKWTSQLLTALATNEAYTGVRVHTSLEADKRRTGKKVYVEQSRYEDAWPALVSVADFATVQALFATRATGERNRDDMRKHLLTGCMRCGVCKGLMNGATYTANNGERKSRYVCARSLTGSKVCQTIDGAGAEEKVLLFLLDYLESEYASIEAPAERSPLDADIAELEALIDGKRERLDMATTAKAELELAASIERLEGKLAQLEAKRPAPRAVPSAVAGIVAAKGNASGADALALMLHAWHALDGDVGQQAAIVRSLLDIEVAPRATASKVFDGARIAIAGKS